ncbi:DUF4145 domain-containing protein [Psychromonas aquimarina]|uniref:DUF4145 domain-containing protein n=1 Tax=Psychromonas aquimarina TaxID=444919 RepID=UPI00042A6AB0|nr:DUF4145 domain-containing protein [Psychromonas aquimarina]
MLQIHLNHLGTINVDSLPNQCPVCKSKVSAIQTSVHSKTQSNCVEIAYQCPNEECLSLFIARYEKLQPTPNTINGFFTLIKCVPNNLDKPDIVEEVAELSPQFCEIFTESYQAEKLGMEQICGIGYRKALEFLIKDFCISEHPTEETKIKGKALAKCINDYIDDIRIKQCSTRAAWLGNDEAHYVRKWSDKDIHDLKILIKLCVLWIQSHLLTVSYTSSMART